MSLPLPQRRRGRRWVIVLSTLLGVFVILEAVVHALTAYQWFGSVGAREVLTTRWVAHLLVFLVVAAVDAAWVGGMMSAAYRMRPGIQTGQTSSMLLQYRAMMDRHHVAAIWIPAGFLALWGGLSAAGQSDMLLAWMHRTDFGVRDPYFGLDASFFVFTYPVLRYAASHAIAMSIVALMSAASVHLVVGGFQGLAAGRHKAGPGRAGAHMSIGLAVVMVFLGCASLLDRYGYAVSSTSLITGVSYTDDHVRLGARMAVALSTFVCALLLMLNARWQRWAYAWSALALLLVVTIILLGIYPGIVQRVRVRPSEPAMEKPYVAANIAATRAAFGVDKVKVTTSNSASGAASSADLSQQADSIASTRLLDPAVVAPTFEALQQKRAYYTFPSLLDVDRYQLGGRSTDVVVAAREVDAAQIPGRSWSNLHTVYTHGYGVVAAYGNRTDGDEPVWAAGGSAATSSITIKEPRIYFGQESTNYVVVGAPKGTAPVELDAPGTDDDSGTSLTTYSGSGGVAIGHWWTRIAWAIRLNDWNLLLSGRVNDESRILTDRQPVERVHQVAPWLITDSQPYPSVVDGRIVWVIDGYTTSATYPNSQRIDWNSAISSSVSDHTLGGAGSSASVNYVRNSVKAVVDAYTGQVTLYAWDEQDPILRTWEKVYPDLLKPRSAIPESLLEHLRYPIDQYSVQRAILARYHTTDPVAWIQQSDLWQVPTDPTRQGNGLQPPYYLTLRMPDEKDSVFSLTSVFTPNGRLNLAAYMSVNADATSPDYGQIQLLQASSSVQIPGPAQTYNAINTNEAVAARLRPFLGSGSSTATYGNLLALPVGGSVVYVVPVYTQTSGTTGSYPALRFVVVRVGDHVGIGDTLDDALEQVIQAGSQSSDAGSGSSGKPATGSGTTRARQLLTKAEDSWKAADKALKAGDLAGYSKNVETARRYTEQAAAALAGK